MTAPGDEVQINIEKTNAVIAHMTPKKKACWQNAILALLFGAVPADALYVEGYAIMGVVPIPTEHGFLLVDGEVVDPTSATAYTAYFVGKVYTKAEVQARAIDGEETLPLFTNGDGWPVEMAAAQRAAFKAVGFDI